ncbi:MAG: FMN-binding protein, partial [Bacteroidales bacterium]|nr:FMN-binding protein [Bacteroidales bacterium]
MNTNSNVYTVVYTAIVVVVVAAVLAFVSQKLGPRQAENEMAETVGQILTAAQFGKIEQWKEMGNAETIEFFENNVMENTSIASTSELKALNYKVKTGEIDDASLPEYTFRNGVTVIPVYGAGLWGPVWGYVAFDKDGQTIVGAYFDHASETPGLGGKIKDDPAFRDQFKGRKVIFGDGD